MHVQATCVFEALSKNNWKTQYCLFFCLYNFAEVNNVRKITMMMTQNWPPPPPTKIYKSVICPILIFQYVRQMSFCFGLVSAIKSYQYLRKQIINNKKTYSKKQWRISIEWFWQLKINFKILLVSFLHILFLFILFLIFTHWG